MNAYKLAPNELTRAHTPEARDSHSGIREIPTLTRGFNEGIAHMYENPVERERMIIEKALRDQITLETRLELRHSLNS